MHRLCSIIDVLNGGRFRLSEGQGQKRAPAACIMVFRMHHQFVQDVRGFFCSEIAVVCENSLLRRRFEKVQCVRFF